MFHERLHRKYSVSEGIEGHNIFSNINKDYEKRPQYSFIFPGSDV